MTREWKVGDVAMVLVDGAADEALAMCSLSASPGFPLGKWRLYDGSVFWDSVRTIRPLVVVDPEDRDQVNHMASELCLDPQDIVRLLRAMLEPPAPPKPDEPGQWGVVTATSGLHSTEQHWVRRNDSRWRDFDGCSVVWDALSNVTVIRPGITPDEPEGEEALPPDLIDSEQDRWTWEAGRYDCPGQRTNLPNRAQIEERYGPVREVPRQAVTP